MFTQLLVRCLLGLLLFFSTEAQAQKLVKLKAGTHRGNLQWEQSLDKVNWIEIENGKTDSIIVKPSQLTYYRAKISEPDCTPLYTDLQAVYADGEYIVKTKIVTGRVIIPTGSVLKLDEMEVLTFFGKSKVMPDGTFEILVDDDLREEIIYVNDKAGNVHMIGYFTGPISSYRIDAETTALGLLITYPMLKPATTTEKENLSKLYRAQSEWASLVNEVKLLHTSGSKLYSVGNDKMITLMNSIINRDYNKDRVRMQSANDIFPDPLSIYASGVSSVTVSNTASYSYVGRIYDKDGWGVSSTFTLLGSAVSDNLYLKAFNYLVFKRDKSSISLNLKELNLSPGTYKIVVSSGKSLNGDNVQLARSARSTNLGDIMMITILSLIPKPSDYLSNHPVTQCFVASIEKYLEGIPASEMDAAFNGGASEIKKRIILPYFKSNEQFLDMKCINVSFLGMLRSALQSLGLVDKLLPSTWFLIEWLKNPSNVTGCQTLTKELKSDDCYVIEKINSTKDQYYTCDSVELKVKVLRNIKFYPYKNDPVPFKDILWLSLQGGGGFPPDGAINSPGRTDAEGIASIYWRLPAAPTDNWVKAVANNTFDDVDSFKTRTVTPRMKVIFDGSGQTGTVNTPLKSYISLAVEDLLNANRNMATENFEIKWRVVRGGGSVPQLVISLFGKFIWSWTLGPEKGEQILEATITRKNNACDWQIENNVIQFKATANADMCLDPSDWWRSLDPTIQSAFNSLIGRSGTALPDAAGLQALFNIENLNLNKRNLKGTLIIPSCFRKLWELRCEENQLSGLTVDPSPILRYIDCYDNNISKIEFLSSSYKIESISCGNNPLKSINFLRFVPGLKSLGCKNTQLTSLDLSPVPLLNGLGCDNNQLTSLNLDVVPGLVTLTCANNQLTNLNISRLKSLYSLYCANNLLTSLNTSGLTKLAQLTCSNNKIASLNVTDNTALEILRADNNLLSTLSKSSLRSLWRLDISNNRLASLSLSGMTNLQYVRCDNNQLTQFSVSGTTMINNIDCSNNRLSALDVKEFTTIQGFICNNNMLGYNGMLKVMQDLPKIPYFYWGPCGSNNISSSNGPDSSNPYNNSDCDKITRYYSSKF